MGTRLQGHRAQCLEGELISDRFCRRHTVFCYMINEATKEYIRRHRMDDVRLLALKQSKRLSQDALDRVVAETIDLPIALQQIDGWQTARHKLPEWAAVEGLIYPPHLSMEQCSSEQTARYKATLAGNGQSFVDLTGGFGVDFFYMARRFCHSVYVEQQEELCTIARHNFPLLGLNATIICCSAIDYLAQMEPVDVIYLDPARRDAHGLRTYSITDCTPNVLAMLPQLQKKANTVILKLSPMLDWHKAVSDLGCVSEVHILSVNNECKELLLVLRWQTSTSLRLVCANEGTIFECSPSKGPRRSQQGTETVPVRDQSLTNILDLDEILANGKPVYLYEPNASIMKAGCFNEIGHFYHICELSANSHLFVSLDEIGNFPGRRFCIERITTMNKHELKEALGSMERANITVRNFPMSVDALRKKLRLKEGGDAFIFATTDADGRHLLLICRKIG